MSKLVLTADQIFALAYILKAKHIDYYYVMLANKDDSNPLWLDEITKQLVAQGILTEDFSGDTTIDSEVENLIKPLYFCTKESALDISIFGEKEEHKDYRFHFLDDRITMTENVGKGFEISFVDPETIREISNNVIPSGYSAKSAKVDITFDADEVSRLFVVKNTEMNTESKTMAFVEREGVIYEEDEEDNIYSLSGEDFTGKIYKILTEV